MDKELPPHIQLAIMSRGYVLSRAIHTVAHLGIADYMSDSPITVDELAQQSGTQPDLLNRLLHFLCDYGLFTQHGNAYALTPLSQPLKTTDPFSMNAVLGMFDEHWWCAFSQLETTLKTGAPAFNEQHGDSFFEFFHKNPAKKTQYEKGMITLAAFDNKILTQTFNFQQFKCLVDVGYKGNTFSKAMQENHPSVSTIPFTIDPSAITTATQELFSTIPKADAYIFKGILHDFNDNDVKKILKFCHSHMKKDASLIIAEQMIPDNELPHTNKTMDIIMMVLVGGQQRTQGNWCQLIESAGFKLKTTVPTSGLFTLMEFKPIYKREKRGNS